MSNVGFILLVSWILCFCILVLLLPINSVVYALLVYDNICIFINIVCLLRFYYIYCRFKVNNGKTKYKILRTTVNKFQHSLEKIAKPYSQPCQTSQGWAFLRKYWPSTVDYFRKKLRLWCLVRFWIRLRIGKYGHFVKYCNFSKFSVLGIFRKGTFSAEVRAILPKLGEITVFYAVGTLELHLSVCKN